MILFIHTETAEKPQNIKAPVTETENWPRITQLDFSMYQDNGDLFKSFEFSINESSPIITALFELVNCINLSHTLVAHNMNLHFSLTAAEMIRTGVKAKYKIPKLCTMEAAIEISKIPEEFGPGIKELYFLLFGEEFNGGGNVHAIAKCFFELRKRGLLTI